MSTLEDTTTYTLEGSLLEVCSCGVLCPCFVGEDPDGGECFGLIVNHIDTGRIGSTDVSHLNMAMVAHIPGNPMEGSWKVALFVDDSADDEQQDALVRAFSGELGGPLADLAGLVGEVVSVRRAPMRYEAADGSGRFTIEGIAEAEFEPISPLEGQPANLRNSAFSSVPDAPAYLAKASNYTVSLPELDMEWSYRGHNATQTAWRAEHDGR